MAPCSYALMHQNQAEGAEDAASLPSLRGYHSCEATIAARRVVSVPSVEQKCGAGTAWVYGTSRMFAVLYSKHEASVPGRELVAFRALSEGVSTGRNSGWRQLATMPLKLPTKTALPRNAFITSNSNQARLKDEAKDKAHASEDQRREAKGGGRREGGKKTKKTNIPYLCRPNGQYS